MHWSLPPDASTLPSGEKATDRRPFECLRSGGRLGFKTTGSTGPGGVAGMGGSDLPAVVVAVVGDPIVAVAAAVAPVPAGHQELTRNQPASKTPATTRAPTRPAATNDLVVRWRAGMEGSAACDLASVKTPSVWSWARRRLRMAATSAAEA